MYVIPRARKIVPGRRARTTLLTVIALSIIELVTYVVQIPTPIPSLAVVAYATFTGGLHAGLISAAITSVYGAVFYSSAEGLLTYTRNDAWLCLPAPRSPSLRWWEGQWRDCDAASNASARLYTTPPTPSL